MLTTLGIQGLVFGFIAAFFWGTHSVIVRYLVSDIDGMTIAILRLYIAAFIFFLFLKSKKEKLFINISDRKFLITLFAVALNFAFFHIGLEYTTATNAILLESTAPIFVLIFLYLFLRERIRRIDIAATVVTVAGVFFIVMYDIVDGGDTLHGDLLELLAAVTWAVFIIGSSKMVVNLTTTVDKIKLLFNLFLLSAVLLTPFLFFTTFDISANNLLYLILLGVFPTAFAYLFWYEAASKMSTISAALIFNLSIVFTIINAYFFLGEKILTNMIIGALLIIVGITLSKFSK